MLSLPSPKPLSLSSSSSTSTTTVLLRSLHFTTAFKTPAVISASSSSPPPPIPNLIIPKSSSSASPQPQNLYQPYRPPPTPLPSKYKSLDTAAIIDILANRLGLWYDYAPLISNLFRDGFTHPSIEELTGISGVEQNRLVVAAQVRESIAESPQIDPETLAYFDNGGSELLYEIRLLSASQRAAAANYIVRNKLDGDKARELARSIKDFPAKQSDPGRDRFDYTKPGDCWAFTYLRLSREFPDPSVKRSSALQTALEVVESEAARARIVEEMEGKGEEKDDEREKEDAVRVPVVRLRMGEVAEATTVVVLPVCKAEERETGLARAPFEFRSEGEFGVVVSDKGWDRWVVLPRWAPVAGMVAGGGGVAVLFPNAKGLPWRVHRSYKEEPVLVVADRGRRDVDADGGFYLVAGGGSSDGGGGDGGEGGLKVERGSVLKEMGVDESLGTVVIVVRPPRDEGNDQLRDEDWD